MSRPMPVGTVTFLFTDIEGSTEKWEKDREAMAPALRSHDAVAADAVEAGGGMIFKKTGDGVCAAFPDASSAVTSALDLRRRLSAEDWPPTIGPLRVRMGIHTGSAEERQGDYFGPALNRVARLMESGHGGQILVSDATRVLLDRSFVVEDLGEHRLRDLLDPEHIYQVGEAGERHPPLRTLDAHEHNLPVQVTPFVGREREVADLVELVPASPLVTLTGPGGTGKTRLALQAAAEMVDRFHSVVFVGLATVSEPEDLAATIAESLGLQVHTPAGVEPALIAALAGRRHLLLLDNFEQLSQSSLLIGELIAAVADLRVMVTSRELLRLRAERNYPVAPLQVPARSLTGVAELAGFEAVRLFEERTRAVDPAFVIDADNAREVAEICRRLDGLPLAIELAAARMRLFTTSTLLTALEGGSGVLGSGPRDAPARHRTLVETIRWSYDLLDEVERSTFRRLSVCVEGCTFEAFEAIVLEGIDVDAYSAVEALADRSLARVAPGVEGEPRIGMLETIRSFAALELEDSTDHGLVRDRHASYFADLAEQAEPNLRGRGQERWMRRLDEERGNIEAALSWSFGDGDPVAGLRLVAALRDYWFYQGQYREMGRWADRAMTMIGGRDPALRAGVLLTTGFHAFGIYRSDAAELIGRAVALYGEAGDDFHRALALVFEAGARALASDALEDGRPYLEEGLSLARAVGAENVVAQALNMWGEMERGRGNHETARQIQEQSLEIARRTGEERRVAMVLHNLGVIAHHLGDDDRAHRLIEEALRLSVEIGFEANVSHCLIAIAEQVGLRGDPERAATVIGAAEAHFRRLGLIPQPADAPDYDRIRQTIRDRLGDDPYRSFVAEGSRLALDEAVELAAPDR